MYKHISSTDENPNHAEYDAEVCGYYQAIARQEEYLHADHFHLSSDIMAQAKDIFEDLSNLTLLEKIAHCKTQNANECVNSTVWNLLPKVSFENRMLVELAMNISVCKYNEGNIAVLDVLHILEVPIGERMVKYCQKEDQTRVVKKKRKEQSGNGHKRTKSITKADDQYQTGLCDYE